MEMGFWICPSSLGTKVVIVHKNNNQIKGGTFHYEFLSRFKESELIKSGFPQSYYVHSKNVITSYRKLRKHHFGLFGEK